MSSGIHFSGLITGIDADSLIQKLVAFQQQKILALQGKKKNIDKVIGELNTVNTKLLSLKDSISSFTDSSVLDARKVSLSDDSYFSVDVSTNALEGLYNVKVLQLATATQGQSSSYIGKNIDPTALLKDAGFKVSPQSGSFTLTHNGVSSTFTFNTYTESLNDIIDKINNDSSLGVTASYDSSTDKLILEATDSNPIYLGSPEDKGNFFAFTHLNTAQIDTSANYKLTSSIHLGGVNPNVEISSLSSNFKTQITAGTFSINGETITVQNSDTLTDILSKINESNAGVRAYYDSINDTVHIVNKDEGAKIIQIQDITSNFFSAVNITSDDFIIGNKSILEINGQNFYRDSNTIKDVLDGVTFYLKKTQDSASDSILMNIDRDYDKIADSIDEFVKAFNDSASELYDSTRFAVYENGKQKEQAGLLSDVTIASRSLSSLLSLASKTFYTYVSPTDTNNIGSFRDIGITIDYEVGQAPVMKFDRDKFISAFKTNESKVRDLLANYYNTFDEALEPLTSSDDTGFKYAIKVQEDKKTSLDKDIAKLEEKTKKDEQYYREKFAALEKAAAKYQMLSSQLAALGSLNYSSNPLSKYGLQ